MNSGNVPTMALAIADEHAIFLDCVADRYFALSGRENDALLRLLAGTGISPAERQALTALTGVEASAEYFQSLLATRVTSAPLRGPCVEKSCGRATCLSAIRHLFVAKTRLKLCGLHGSLERLSRIPPWPTSDQAPEAAQKTDHIIGAHDWMSRHFTANDACLLRSLALAYHLRSSGCAAQLVIAVKSDPFAAHCWVQSDDQLLNEDLDAVASFEPILVVQ